MIGPNLYPNPKYIGDDWVGRYEDLNNKLRLIGLNLMKAIVKAMHLEENFF